MKGTSKRHRLLCQMEQEVLQRIVLLLRRQLVFHLEGEEGPRQVAEVVQERWVEGVRSPVTRE